VKLLGSLEKLKGVGPSLLKNFAIILPDTRVIDLILHLPNKTTNYQLINHLEQVQDGKNISFRAITLEYKPNFRKNSPFSVIVETELKDGLFNIVKQKISIDFFYHYKNSIEKSLPLNQAKIISGKCKTYKNKIHIIHPEHITDDLENLISNNYQTGEKLNNKVIHKLIKQCFESFPDIGEWQDPNYVKEQNFLTFKESLYKIHYPQNNDKESYNLYKNRIAYDEIFALQLALRITHKHHKKILGNIIKPAEKIINKFIKELPFTLTKAQNKVLTEIFNDQSSNRQMTRLIQGDVGCGKTVIAIIAIINNVMSGYQAAFMAPTAILAKQHYNLIKTYLKNYHIKACLLIGEVKGKERKKILSDLEQGNIDIIIGTHALFYDKVKFANLGLSVIDEQHRFGVKQRMNLTNKGIKSDLLLMSATPIPRSLALTIYGNMDISIIDQKPANREKIDTRIISTDKISDIIQGLERAIKNNEKIYWICPLIEESPSSNLAAITQRYQQLKKIFPQNMVAFINGKMTQEEKDDVLNNFLNNKHKILLATTVIEVGINIADATIMIIENADKFGLAQLHQLRGRVGRGNKAGKCILLYNSSNKNEDLSYKMKKLQVIKAENDGFKIAEEDLKMRGSGDIMGTKQSGVIDFRIANLKEHYKLLKIANQDAEILLNKDPTLSSVRGIAAKKLLEIFSMPYQTLAQKTK
jgi:ATP-dependent DNA helicase RecG